MKVSNQFIRLWFVLFIVCVALSLFYLKTVGKSDDFDFIDGTVAYVNGIDQFNEGKYDTALALLDLAEDVDPNSASIKYYKGLTLASLDNYEDGTRNMQESLYLNPHQVEDPLFILQYSLMLLDAGKTDEAIETFDKYKEIPEKDVETDDSNVENRDPDSIEGNEDIEEDKKAKSKIDYLEEKVTEEISKIDS